MMNIMTDKGYLERHTEGNTHIFRARLTERAARKGMLGDMVRRVFDGSPAALLPLSLSTSLPPEQIEMLLLHELAHLRRAGQLTGLALLTDSNQAWVMIIDVSVNGLQNFTWVQMPQDTKLKP